MPTDRQKFARSESGLYDATVVPLRKDLALIEEEILTNLVSWEQHVHLVGKRDATVAALVYLKDAYEQLYGPPGGAEPEDEDDERS